MSKFVSAEQRATAIAGVLLTVLLAGWILEGQLGCRIGTNMVGLMAVRNWLSSGVETEAPLGSMTTCPQGVYVGTHLLLSAGNTRAALDFWQSYTTMGTSREVLFPVFFRTALAARRVAQNGDWDGAVEAYRRMFREAATSSQGGESLPLKDIEPEYEQALIRAYASRDAQLDALSRLRQALWIWRAGKPQLALNVLNQVNVAGEESSLQSLLESYRLLMEADVQASIGQYAEAAHLYAKIPASEPSAYLRGLIEAAHLEDRYPTLSATLHWRDALSRWKPEIDLDYALPAGNARLFGVQVLEPELIPDGGQVCVLLFWQGDPHGRDQLALGDNRFVQEICARNLIQDPGFEWPRTGMRASDWYGEVYPEDGNPAQWGGMVASELGSNEVCLNNLPNGTGRSGIFQQAPRLAVTDRLLLAARLKTDGSPVGILMGRWQDYTLTPDYFYAGAAVHGKTNSHWIGGLVVPPPSIYSAQVYVVNHGSGGTVCVSDLIMLRLNIP